MAPSISFNAFTFGLLTAATVPLALASPITPSSPLLVRQNPAVQCAGQWDTVTNDPTVQWWHMVVPNVQVDHAAFWNHLNLNDCAPTDNTVYTDHQNNGVAIKFHASNPCTHTHIEEAFRSASHPPTNIGCDGPGTKGGSDPFDEGIEGAIGVLEGIFESLGDE